MGEEERMVEEGGWLKAANKVATLPLTAQKTLKTLIYVTS